MAAFVTKDSGARQEFETGARRDIQEGKGRFDLIPAEPLIRLAQLYERGAKKYGPHNWTKGMPTSRYLDSAFRHLVQYIAGDREEDHLIGVVWNIFSLIATEERVQRGMLPASLLDIMNPMQQEPCGCCNPQKPVFDAIDLDTQKCRLCGKDWSETIERVHKLFIQKLGQQDPGHPWVKGDPNDKT
jgi:hypothetical protein